MELINKDLILKEIPFFADLSAREAAIVKERCALKGYKKNEIIYKEGSSPDAFYCVVLGRVMIYTQDRYGSQAVLEYLHHGKYFGIISLLTNEPHSVTACAINDCLLLVILKDDFDFILKEIPRLAIGLSQTLSRRLKNEDIHQKTIFESTVISVFSSYSHAGKTIYALNLALSLHKETHKSAVILDILPKDRIHSMPARLGLRGDYRIIDLSYPLDNAPQAIKGYILKNIFGADLICLHYKTEDEFCLQRLVGILTLLVNDYHYIIMDLPSSMDRPVYRILNQSDLIHILSGPQQVDLRRTASLIERLKTDFNFQEAKIKVIINEYKFSRLSHERQLGLVNYPIFATLPRIDCQALDRFILDSPDCEYSKAVRRISRRVGDCQVGLALGVGVAYGFCHIGVLKVIEEENIPVDVISGSSVGALIASLWAIGKSSEEILEITGEFKEPKFIWGLIDLTLPFLGFIKGNKLYNFLKRHLGDKTFHDVKLPLKIIASDVKRKEPKILERGLLADAIMASCTMPGVFMPFKFNEGMLFDGGVINPLPTEPLFKMGVRKIIAVNVTPSREDILRQFERMKGRVSPDILSKKKWFDIKQYFRDKFRINILDIIFSSIEILQSEVAQKEAQLADIVLHPDTSGLFWLELHRALDFAKRGEEEARRNLDKIWQIINE